ncbi:Transcription initiation factor TFIID subunit 6 [Cichlidogyrus casuarinus]|uniref:Histone H4 n=1 Tax=Cichlidogyrus casuarinus TaxID=1844966 RepID=A0ABD2QGZ0_9PLAT
MESTKKKKLNKLVRKACNPVAKPAALKTKTSTSKASKSTTKANWKPSERKEFTDEQMQICADMIGLSNVPKESLSPLTKHITQLANLMIYGAIRYMEQAKRGTPQTCDIDAAATNLGLQVVRGTSTGEFMTVSSGGKLITNSFTNNKPLFFKPEREIEVKTLLIKDPAAIVYDISLVAHWLIIDGKQPACPQNPSPAFLNSLASIYGSKKPIEINKTQPTIDKSNKLMHPRSMQTILKNRQAHEVSQEMMVYFRELTEACVGASEQRRSEAFENVTLDTGLQSLLPHLVTFITEGVRVNVNNLNLAILIYLMRLVKALLENSHVSLEPYLHMLIPTVITCILCRELCAKPITDNHWALRDFAAKQLVTICNKYNTPSNELYQRITRQISRALVDWIEARPGSNKNSQKVDSQIISPIDPASGADFSGGGTASLGLAVNSLNTLYGLIVVLVEFGRNAVRSIIFPVLPALCAKLTVLVEPPESESTSSQSAASKSLSVASANTTAGATPVLSNTYMSAADVRSYDMLRTMIVVSLFNFH